MNRAQKIARFNLIVILIALSLSAIAVSVFYFVVDLPIRRAFGGFGFMGITGLMGLSPLLYKKERDKVSFDERDELINYRAVLAAYSVFWLVFTAACMIPWSIIGPSGSISVNVLPIMLFGIGITLALVYSLVILVQYGWTGKGEKS
ncbi:MAG: hypothetical protein ACYSYL_19145 [Planctomycetota bacterium]|jgi:hypothetical protein